ncbi:unnamed protein product [Peniophora sp. CBMAI 1063]|nr:unnamed protein product [Peniophora sp. CBMAI 1063]
MSHLSGGSSGTGTSAGSAKLLNDYQLGDSLGKGAFGQVYRALNWATGETVAVKEIQLSNIPKNEIGQIMQLGDSLGKGAFGQVYRALNWATGETVAVKEIQLSNIPKNEIGQIMSEIDLLKNLNHPNIVKYKGFVKTREFLYIILEFCENGSLNHICKRFGKFPENLVAVYISQVLEGLVYLHDQGVIHRDIKGANILTTKDGAVKLADFGVASNTTAAGAANDDAVVGSPYWMAPEVIEQSGATTASDIWSVGCTVIELLEGRPPYHFLKPMPALYRIVQDDCPPIPEGASPIVKDFLYHCSQKDVNLRISAKKLLRHPWMVQVKKQLGVESAPGPSAGGQTSRTASQYNYDEAVLKVQEWNEALKSPRRPSKHPRRGQSVRDSPPESPTETAFGLVNAPTANLSSSLLGQAPALNGKKMPIVANKSVLPVPAVLVQPEEQTDNWDDDFEEGISFSKLQALEKTAAEEDAKEKEKREREARREREDADNAKTIRPSRSPGGAPSPSSRPRAITPIVEDYSDLGDDGDDAWAERLQMFQQRNPAAVVQSGSTRRGLFHPDDIKTLGISGTGGNMSPGPRTAPLPSDGSPSNTFLFGNMQSSAAGASGSGSIGSTRRGLFYPDDIKTLGSSGTGGNMSPGPRTALPSDGSPSNTFLFGNMQSSAAGASGSGSMSGRPKADRASRRASTGRPELVGHGHGRSPSFAGPSPAGSIGRGEMRRMQSDSHFERYAETDDEDYEDVFGKPNGTVSGTEAPMQLTTRLSNKSWLGDEDTDEEDPFAEIDEGFDEDDLEANLQHDKYARLTSNISSLIDELSPAAPDFQLRDACDQLMGILTDAPEMHVQFMSSHGMEVIMRLLQIINLLVTADAGFLESFCLIGGIPVMMGFTSKKYPSECRLEASNFIQLLCHTSVLTLQICRGLKVLVDLLDEDFAEQTDLVVHALGGIGSVFELQSPTTKNDFCRMFIREGLLDPLSSALLNVMVNRGPTADEMKRRIIAVLLVFCQVSQQDIHVRKALGTRKVVRRLLRACELLEPEYLVQMLKAIKHLSMNAMLLEVLQNANAIEILTRILDEQSAGPHSTEMSNHIFQALYNLCRLNKGRQEEAAQAGIIPCLVRIVRSASPLKQLALPILCDLASAGKSCRTLLWQHGGLNLYIELLTDPYFQVSALESVLAWLQEETARVEDELLKQSSLDALLKCFVSAKAGSFENLLDPLLKIIRLAPPVAIGIAKTAFFKRVVEKLGNSKAVVKLNLLRILRAVYEIHPNRASLVVRLRREDPAVLVRELEREIEPSLRPALAGRASAIKALETPKSGVAPKKRSSRRTASDTSGVSMISPNQSLASSGAREARKSHLPSRNRLGDIPWQAPGGGESR